jgi:ribosome-associated toxin RatA of RatAB toxin-antitoxin module
MQSTLAVEIEAPAELVFGLAHRVERWEAVLPHYLRSRIVERRLDGSLVVEFVARRPVLGVAGLGFPVVWRARTWNDPAARRLRFVHVAGPTKGMDVTWRIETTPSGCRVSIEHDFDPRLPGFATFVDRWFTRPIAGRTLATFKVLAETLADDQPAAPPESDRPAATNEES